MRFQYSEPILGCQYISVQRRNNDVLRFHLLDRSRGLRLNVATSQERFTHLLKVGGGAVQSNRFDGLRNEV